MTSSLELMTSHFREKNDFILLLRRLLLFRSTMYVLSF